jgi:hypothetical protein
MVLFREGEFTNSHWRLHYWSSETSSLHIIIIWFDRGHSDGSHFIKIAILTKCSPFPTKSTSTSLPEVDSGSLGEVRCRGAGEVDENEAKVLISRQIIVRHGFTWLLAPACVVFGTSVPTVWIMALYALRCRYAILNVQYDTVR